MVIALLLAAQLFEQPVNETVALRERNYQQLKAWAGSLPVRQAPAGSKLRDKIGYPAPDLKAGSPQFEQIGRDELASYYRCVIPLNAQWSSYGLYLVPNQPSGKKPLMIAQHGGGGSPELALFKAGSNYHDLVRGPLKEGWVVYAPLVVMYPYVDREHGTTIPQEVRGELDDLLRSRGTSLIAAEITAISRALDVLLTRPEIDRKNVVMGGLSYGGYYTLYAMALEPRINAGVASCSFREADPTKTANGPKGRPVDISPWELVKLISPRPLQVQCGLNDKLLPIDSARREHEKVKGVKGLDYREFDGGHEWRGDIAWDFLRNHAFR
jgi:dienelactone hydrolase